MKFYYKNNGELKGELKSVFCSDYSIEIRLLHCQNRKAISTDLEINVLNKDGDYVDTFIHSTIKSEGDYDSVIDYNTNEFESVKKKLYKYLDTHFHNVKIIEDCEG